MRWFVLCVQYTSSYRVNVFSLFIFLKKQIGVTKKSCFGTSTLNAFIVKTLTGSEPRRAASSLTRVCQPDSTEEPAARGEGSPGRSHLPPVLRLSFVRSHFVNAERVCRFNKRRGGEAALFTCAGPAEVTAGGVVSVRGRAPVVITEPGPV